MEPARRRLKEPVVVEDLFVDDLLLDDEYFLDIYPVFSYVEEIPGAYIIRENIEDQAIVDDILEYFERKANAVISDLSPQVTGYWSVDHATQISQNYAAAKIMEQVLTFKGNAVFKVFDGEYSMEFRDYLKKKFAKVKLTKPQASRKPSSELYYICLGYKA